MDKRHVVSLDLAKKLKELGVPQVSEFYWNEGTVNDNKGSIYLVSSEENDVFSRRIASAFISSEIGEMLPGRITNPETRNMDRLYFYFREHRGDNSKQDVRDGYTVEYWTNYSQPLARITADTEADARAKMLCYLIENGLVSQGKGER
jgi:hypothetical protein